jgi:hypothetical protein
VYLPNSFAERDLPTLLAFIEAHPLAALVTSSPTEGLFATHLPLVLDRAVGRHGALFGHVARANPHARLITSDPVDALVIFPGPTRTSRRNGIRRNKTPDASFQHGTMWRGTRTARCACATILSFSARISRRSLGSIEADRPRP